MSTKTPKQSESNILSYLKILPRCSSVNKPNGTPFTVPKTILSENVNLMDSNTSQEVVFERVGAPAVLSALDGYNSTIIAYGQCGSGKSYTVIGGPMGYQQRGLGLQAEERGLIHRALSMLYEECKNHYDLQLMIHISFFELYNEQCYDLLEPAHFEKPREPRRIVSMMEDKKGAFHLTNLSVHSPKTEEEALDLLYMGETNRALGETPMNMASSRSHCIFTISLEMRIAGEKRVRRSKLQIVDLAATASKDRSWTFGPGAMHTEAKHINRSIFALHSVVAALNEKIKNGRTHIPYRNSMLTSVLRDSLGGNCKTFFIATIDPVDYCTKESLSTCKFAQRVSRIKNKAICNEKKLVKRKALEKKKFSDGVQCHHGAILELNDASEHSAQLRAVSSDCAAQRVNFCDGTNPCSLSDFFSDRSAAFAWFEAHYNLFASWDNNKIILKESKEQAKIIERRINRIRRVTSDLYLSIKDLQGDSTATVLAGGFGNCDKDNAEAETAYRRTIELEQASYKKNLNNLRTLNHEIAVLEIVDEFRVPMQDQFESWYAGRQLRNCSNADF